MDSNVVLYALLAIAAAVALLAVAVIVLGAVLLARVRRAVLPPAVRTADAAAGGEAGDTVAAALAAAPEPPGPPPPAKCNARVFTFADGEAIEFHPLCSGVPLEALTDAFATSVHPAALVGVRDEVHFVEVG